MSVPMLARIAAALIAVFAAAEAYAQTTAELGRLAGPQRTQILVEGARREGTITIYSSIPVATMSQITGAFERKYGVRVNLWRSESTQILQRALNEARAGRNAADVVETAAAEAEAMARERLLQDVNLPVFADLMLGAAVPGRPWIASRLTVFVAAYNTNLIRAAEAPKTYRDLLDPKWRGKIGIEAENANWLMALAGIEGRENVEALFRDISARNGLSVRRGHTLLVNLVASGEVPIGLNAYDEHVKQAKENGAPVELVYLPPVIAMPLGLAAFRQAPHPHAAILFLDFMLGEGQQMVADQHMIPANIKVRPLPADLHIIDVPKFVDENEEWLRLYRELFSGRAQ